MHGNGKFFVFLQKNKPTNMDMKQKILVFALLLAGMGANAQQVTKGVVTDKAGNPISGARVEVKGTSFSTTTGIDGRFSLETPMMIDKVRVSSAGRVTRKVDVTPDMVVVMRPTSYWHNPPTRYQFFAGFQLSVPNFSRGDVPMGVMVGVVKKVGLYGRFVTCGQPSTTKSMPEGSGYSYYEKAPYYYYWAEEGGKTGYTAITGGLVIRLGSPIYLTLGVGYAQRKLARLHSSGEWVEMHSNYEGGSRKGLATEAGVMIKFGHFLINAGSTCWSLKDPCFGANFGLNYMF